MNDVTNETKNHIKETLHLTAKSLYKTIEFQLLFKIFYISIFIFIINFLIGVVLDVVNIVFAKLSLGETFENIPILALFDFNVIFVLFTSLFLIIYIYLIEKNGVIIITSEYYRNNFISFFKTLLLSLNKTPKFILRRLIEMKVIIFIFIIMYLLWIILSSLALPEFITSTLGIMLIIYGTGIFFAVLFRYTFTAYITCLEPAESYQEFNKNLPYKFLRKRTYASFVFYVNLFISAILWLLLFYIVTQTLLHFSYVHPEIVSSAIAFFIAFTIVSILITLSLFKTLKVAIMTILYYEERNRQGKTVKINRNTKQPFLSKNIYAALLTIFIITVLGGAFITTTIKTKTDRIATNAQTYINEATENNILYEIKVKDITPEYILQESLQNNTSPLETIEKIIFTIFAYIIIK